MHAWFLCCALSGAVLGLRWPVQVLLLAAALGIPIGLVCQLRHGFDVALVTALGGVMIMQVSYLATTLAAGLLSRSFFCPAAMLRVRSKA